MYGYGEGLVWEEGDTELKLMGQAVSVIKM